MAKNEHLVILPDSRTPSILKGTTLMDGEWYSISYYNYLSDDTLSNVNNITYSYIYRVAGEATVYEGTITLSVL